MVCSEAIRGTPEPDPLATIDRGRAAALGAGTIETQTNILDICKNSIYRNDFAPPWNLSNVISTEPELVQRLFPDGQTRLTWIFAEGCGTNTRSSGSARIVYIDAHTGDPLLLISLSLPYTDATCHEISHSIYFNPNPDRLIQGDRLFRLGIGLTLAYLVAVCIAARVLYWRRKSRLGSPDDSTNAQRKEG
jgi:hypothetical protein